MVFIFSEHQNWQMAGLRVLAKLLEGLDGVPVFRSHLQEDYHGSFGLCHRYQLRQTGRGVNSVVQIAEAVRQGAPWKKFSIEDQRKRLRHAGKMGGELEFSKAFPSNQLQCLRAFEITGASRNSVSKPDRNGP